jgi:KaiC/GvpD/RAD55 family RecA-like ATPase
MIARADFFAPPDPAVLARDLASLDRQLRPAGITREDVAAELAVILGKPRPAGAVGELRARVEQIASGVWASILLPWAMLASLTLAMIPGGLVLFAGGVGASKSLMLLQAFLYWLANKVNVVMLAMEGDRESHLFRALAQLSGISDATDPAWVRAHAGQVRAMLDRHTDTLGELARHWMLAVDLGIDTQQQAAAWAEREAQLGRRILVIDPVTVLTRAGQPWEADQMFVKTLKSIAQKYGTTIICVTHPQRGVTTPTRETIAGGAVWERHSDTILVLQAHEEKTSQIRTSCGTAEDRHNRTLRIEKARHGKGTGSSIALQFCGATLMTSEIGVIKKMKKGDKAW